MRPSFRIIDQLSSSEADQALDILHLGIGASRDDYWNDPNSYKCAAFIEDKIVGSALATVLDIKDRDYLLSELNKVNDHHSRRLQKLLGSKLLFGELSGVSVLPEYQGQGIAKKLIKKRINHLVNQDCHYAITDSWVNPNNDISQSAFIFRKLAFSETDIIPQFWTRKPDLDPKRYQEGDCPICEHRCLCSAIVFWKRIL
jgi:ribosomal protein S18 acetylase RimI-like enzyme